MRKFIVTVTVLFSTFCLQAQPPQTAQEKAQLEKERADLQEEIKAIERDYNKAKNQTKASLGELNALKRKINLQERFLNNINRELKLIDNDIYLSNLEIYRLKNQLDTLKAQYAKSVVYAYKNRSNYDYLNFIFSSNGFNDAMKRISYLKQYRSYRERQVQTITETQALIAQRQKQQLAKKETKNVTLKTQTAQIGELAKQKNEKAAVVTKLQSQEKDLLKQLNAKKKRDKDTRNALNAVIKRLAKENEIARKKAEAEEAKKNVVTNPTTTTTKPTTTTTSNPAAAKPAGNSIEFNAGDIKLSGEFQNNKGRLPWPVDNGYVSIHFGKYQVEELKGIYGESSGITIITDNSGQTVKSVFEGEVVAVHDLGDSKAIFIKHGKYLTSYGNLSAVSVSKGSKVTTGQAIGRNAVADNGAGGQIDFMLLIEAKEQNPEQWLRRR